MCEEGVLSFLVWMLVYFRQCADREWHALRKKVYVVVTARGSERSHCMV